jgi:protein-L-isoaspartate(D-aspartate) O-methyltransferase
MALVAGSHGGLYKRARRIGFIRVVFDLTLELAGRRTMDYAAVRRNMVESQVRTNKVIDSAIIEALSDVPRERFVTDALRSVAYVDEDLPLGRGRYLMEPMILARLLQIGEASTAGRALDIGCATGYSTAILAKLVPTAIGLESDPALAAAAGATLASLGLTSATIEIGALEDGAPQDGPYDFILFGGAVAPGGRAVAVIKSRGAMGVATVFHRLGDTIGKRAVFDAATPLLPGFEPVEGFVF